MLITNIIKSGPLPYNHHYMITGCGSEVASHTLCVPEQLQALAKSSTPATLIVFGDQTLAIEIDGKIWAIENKQRDYFKSESDYKKAKKLPYEIWQYCRLALGQNGDTYNYGS